MEWEKGKSGGKKGWKQGKMGVQESEKGMKDESMTMLLSADQQLWNSRLGVNILALVDAAWTSNMVLCHWETQS